MIEETKPTMSDCLEAVTKINEGIPNTEELLMHKARWLYMLNRLNFWNDMPVMLDIIKYEIEVKKLSKADVMRSVFIVQGENLLLHGCFDSREKAEKYANGSSAMRVQEVSVG